MRAKADWHRLNNLSVPFLSFFPRLFGCYRRGRREAQEKSFLDNSASAVKGKDDYALKLRPKVSLFIWKFASRGTTLREISAKPRCV